MGQLASMVEGAYIAKNEFTIHFGHAMNTCWILDGWMDEKVRAPKADVGIESVTTNDKNEDYKNVNCLKRQISSVFFQFSQSL
jgi:hypothetical protein